MGTHGAGMRDNHPPPSQTKPGSKTDWEMGVESERQRCAAICGAFAWMMENGAGELNPGGRLRQAQSKILEGEKPLQLKDF